MDVVYIGMLLGEKILGMGSRGREGLGVRPRREAGGLREAKEMNISMRTVGPERQRTTERSDLSCKGEGLKGRGETVRERRSGGA